MWCMSYVKLFLRKYDCFPVRLGGQEKIQNCLYGMKVENVRTFLTLFPFEKWDERVALY